MAATSQSQQRCVFVGNIPYDVTEEQLVQICEEVGPVVSFRLVVDRETGKPKGYGFCEYKDEETALSARRNLQGYDINGRQLRVDFAETGKTVDRNREPGRGGPGTTSNPGPQKQPGAVHQPMGDSVATAASTVMAMALGATQILNDPLTNHLARMSRSQLMEIISELKAMALQNKEQVRQLLLAIPSLPKALLQAQIMLGMVTPEMLQATNIRQASDRHAMPAQSQIQRPQLHQNQLLQQSKVSSLPNAQAQSAGVARPYVEASTSSSVKQHEQSLPLQNRSQTPIAKASMPMHSAGPSKGAMNMAKPTSVPFPASNVSIRQVSMADETPGGKAQVSQLQLPSGVDSTLLQQLLSLTPQQISSLPPDQQQQVIQLQQMLSRPA